MEVKEVITPRLFTVPAETPCHEVAKLMDEGARQALMVVEAGRVVGTVARTDLVPGGGAGNSVPVSKIMNRRIVYCYASDDAEATIEAMDTLDIGCFVVVDERRKPVGVVCRQQLSAVRPSPTRH